MDGLLTLPQAAIRLRRPYITVYGLATAGRLGPMEKQGRTYVLTVAGVEAFLRGVEQARNSVE